MKTPEQEIAWLAGLSAFQATYALALMAHTVTVLARGDYRTDLCADIRFMPADFNERVHRLVGFILHAGRGEWTSSMARSAVTQVEGLGSFMSSEDGIGRTLMQDVLVRAERFGPK